MTTEQRPAEPNAERNADAQDPAPPSDAAQAPTGEPKQGWLGLYQRIEDMLGQGTVASLLIVVGFLIFACWQIATL